MKRNLWFSFACLVLVTTAHAAERYEVSDGTILEGVERFDGTLPKAALTILGVTLDENTFSDVRSSLGSSSEILKASHPHDADSICYSSAPDRKVRLIFSSGGPEDPTDKLTSFTLVSDGASKNNGHCSTSNKLTGKVRTLNGLGLGLSQAEVESILGTPSKITASWVIYAYQKYHSFTPEESASMPRAPGGGDYKGVFTYHDLVMHFTDGKSDKITVNVGGEVDW